jgi:glyoxylase-like metal-dependent hydrolase (beta-lactamase superfamily II)
MSGALAGDAPVVTPILASVVTLPDTHPEGPGPCVVDAFLIRYGDAAFLVDTGVGSGYAPIDSRYRPERADLLGVLAGHGVRPGGVTGVICSHLHFDHCGNNRLFAGVPIYVQRTEYEAAQGDRYTVREWLLFAGADYRLLDGALDLTPRVRIVPTPGHTIGHQSVVVMHDSGVELVVAQAAYSAAEFQSYLLPSPHLRDDAWSKSAYAQSIRELHALQPRRAYFTHDANVWNSSSPEVSS